MAHEEPDYGRDVQLVLLQYWISDPHAFAVSRSIIKDEYFDNDLRKTVRYIQGYADSHKDIPAIEQIRAHGKIALEKFSETSPQHTQWFLGEIERFCRYRALELAIIDGVDMLREGRAGELQTRIRDAMTISLMSDLGTEYFADPLGRIERMRDHSALISTGYSLVDSKLMGGTERGGLGILAAGSGMGKSLMLQNLAINYAEMGFTVVYFSLELSEDLISLRLDAMMTGKTTKDIIRDPNGAAATIAIKGKKPGMGSIYLKKFPQGGTTCHDLLAYMKEFEIKTGRKPDVILVDYLDLLYPATAKVDVSNLFIKDKYTSEELRSLAHETNTICWTASQINRQGVEAQEYDHSHISGGISKINTADNVIGLYAPPSLKEKGQFRLQFLKTRTSSATGAEIVLVYDPASMRISDPPNSPQDLLHDALDQQKREVEAQSGGTRVIDNILALTSNGRAAK